MALPDNAGLSSQSEDQPQSCDESKRIMMRWLEQHGFDKYSRAFESHRINSMAVLALLSRGDLRHVTGVVGDAVRLHEVLK